MRAPLAALVLALAVAGCAESMEEAPAPRVPPGQVYAPPASQPGAVIPGTGVERGGASYYSDRLAGRRTASGEPYDPSALTAAHRTLPLGTLVDVARPDGRHVTVRINDRGPHVAGRVIDLSRRAAGEIGLLREGVAEVVLRIVWVPPPRARRR